MPTEIRQITTFSAQRCNNYLHTHPKLARAYMTILARVHDLLFTSDDPERDVLDYLRQLHTDPNLAKACADVLKLTGN